MRVFILMFAIALPVSGASAAGDIVLPLEGSLSPISTVYWTDPGQITFHGYRLQFNRCESAHFDVLANERRNDTNWQGQFQSINAAKAYLLFRILISNETTCEVAAGQVIEFRIPADNPEEIGVTVFHNRESLEKGASDGWGLYGRSEATPNNSLERTRAR